MAKRKNKNQHYEVHYLALALILFLLAEAVLFSVAGQADWQAGIEMLDMSSSVGVVVADVQEVMQPISDTLADLSLFYDSATTEMLHLLDFSGEETFAPLMLITDGVYNFYQEASDALIALIDTNSVDSWPAQVAGVSVVAY